MEIEEHYISFDLLYATIAKKQEEYVLKYGAYPHYIMLPRGTTAHFQKNIVLVADDKNCYFCGMAVCESARVRTIDDIEAY